MKTKIFASIAFAVVATSAWGQVSLEFKQRENETYTSRLEIKVAQVLTLGGMDLGTKNLQVMETSHATGARADDGTLRAKTKIDKWNSKLTLPMGIALEFDSAAPDKKAPIAELEPVLEFMRTMLKTPVTLVYDKDGMVKTAEFPDDAARDVPKEFANDLKPETLAAQHKDQQKILPDKAIAKGDTWTADHVSNLGSGQTLKLRVDYQYKGRVQRKGRELDHITGTVTRTEYDNAGAFGPLKVKASELKPAKSTYEVYFDAKLWRIVDLKTLVQIKGDMAFEVNGMELPGKLDLTLGVHAVELPMKD